MDEAWRTASYIHNDKPGANQISGLDLELHEILDLGLGL